MATTPRQILRYELDFNTWANERVLKAAVALTPEELAGALRQAL